MRLEQRSNADSGGYCSSTGMNKRQQTQTFPSEALGLIGNVGVDAAENESTKGEKRENRSEGEDDDRAGKRLKWDTLG